MSSFEKELKEQQERHRIADLTDEERAAWRSRLDGMEQET